MLTNSNLANNNKTRLSIQVDLNGFSFDVLNEGDNTATDSEVKENFSFNAVSFDQIELEFIEKISSQPLLKENIYTESELYFHTSKYTLVPRDFFDPSELKTTFYKVHSLDMLDELSYVNIDSCNAVLIYAIPSALTSYVYSLLPKTKFYPAIYKQLNILESLGKLNRIVADYRAGILSLTIANEKGLLLCNSFPAIDFTTSLYFILNSLNELNFNPSQSNLHILSPLSEEDYKIVAKYLMKVVSL